MLRNTLLKDKINIDDEESQINTYLISMIAKNSEESNRKCFDMNLLAFKKLLDNGYNAYLYLHTSFIGKCNINTIIENLNIDYPNNVDLDASVHTYNGIIPFIRSGLQLNLGLFTINPFVGYDLQTIYFDKLDDISSSDLKESLKQGAIRTGIEFGIMF